VFSVRAPTRGSDAVCVPASSTLAVEDERLVLHLWRQRYIERKMGRRLSVRKRRMLTRRLRRTANRAVDAHPVSRRRELLLSDRVAAVRGELLEIAGLLERAKDTDPRSVADLYKLLSDGCDSPLCNPDIHVSELRATLYYVRSRLTTRALSTEERSDSPPAEPTGRPPRSTVHGAMSAHRSCKAAQPQISPASGMPDPAAQAELPNQVPPQGRVQATFRGTPAERNSGR
jgi:hypothetical protein